MDSIVTWTLKVPSTTEGTLRGVQAAYRDRIAFVGIENGAVQIKGPRSVYMATSAADIAAQLHLPPSDISIVYPQHPEWWMDPRYHTISYIKRRLTLLEYIVHILSLLELFFTEDLSMGVLHGFTCVLFAMSIDVSAQMTYTPAFGEPPPRFPSLAHWSSRLCALSIAWLCWCAFASGRMLEFSAAAGLAGVIRYNDGSGHPMHHTIGCLACMHMWWLFICHFYATVVGPWRWLNAIALGLRVISLGI